MRRTRDPAGQATGGALEVSDCASVLPEHSPCSLDPQVIRVELGQRRRRSGDTFPVAVCSIAEVEGSASPICSLARVLIAAGHDPGTLVEVWRGSTLCFAALPISKWAGLTVKEAPSGPVFVPYVPFSRIPVASGSAESDD